MELKIPTNNMSNEELDLFKEYVRKQCLDHRGELSYPMMSGYLLGVVADLATEFPQVAHVLMERIKRDSMTNK
jgi:hypothetical protein